MQWMVIPFLHQLDTFFLAQNKWYLSLFFSVRSIKLICRTIVGLTKENNEKLSRNELKESVAIAADESLNIDLESVIIHIPCESSGR